MPFSILLLATGTTNSITQQHHNNTEMLTLPNNDNTHVVPAMSQRGTPKMDLMYCTHVDLNPDLVLEA